MSQGGVKTLWLWFTYCTVLEGQV